MQETSDETNAVSLNQVPTQVPAFSGAHQTTTYSTRCVEN